MFYWAWRDVTDTVFLIQLSLRQQMSNCLITFQNILVENMWLWFFSRGFGIAHVLHTLLQVTILEIRLTEVRNHHHQTSVELYDNPPTVVAMLVS